MLTCYTRNKSLCLLILLLFVPSLLAAADWKEGERYKITDNPIALHQAVRANRCDLVKGILGLRVNVNQTDPYGKTALDYAVATSEIYSALEAKGAKKGDPKKRPHMINNPLVLIAAASKYNGKEDPIDLPGVEQDFKLLQEIFEEDYGYAVYTTHTSSRRDPFRLNYRDLKRFIDNHFQRVSDSDAKECYDSLIFIWSGHGEQGSLITSDGEEYKISAFWDDFCNHTDCFLGKPKILFKLGCRGESYGVTRDLKRVRGSLSESPMVANIEGDILEIYANTRGKVVEDTNKGSLLALELKKLLTTTVTHAPINLALLVTALRVGVEERAGFELPQEVGTLKRKVYLEKRWSKRDQAALVLACQQGDVAAAKGLLDRGRVGINRANKAGQTPLWIACEQGEIEVVKLLLSDQCVEVNQANKYFQTPLCVACKQGKIEVIKELLADQRVRVNQASYGSTPLWIACYYGHREVVKLLLSDHRVEVNQVDNSGRNPLWIACEQGKIEVVKLLLSDHRVEVNQANRDGSTPLWIACYYGHSEVVKTLLTDWRVEVNQAATGPWAGSTPLWVASREGYSELVKVLLADPRVAIKRPDKDGWTPYQIAEKNNHKGILTHFKDRGIEESSCILQ